MISDIVHLYKLCTWSVVVSLLTWIMACKVTMLYVLDKVVLITLCEDFLKVCCTTVLTVIVVFADTLAVL